LPAIDVFSQAMTIIEILDPSYNFLNDPTAIDNLTRLLPTETNLTTIHPLGVVAQGWTSFGERLDFLKNAAQETNYEQRNRPGVDTSI
jgi:hypothetical protein